MWLKQIVCPQRYKPVHPNVFSVTYTLFSKNVFMTETDCSQWGTGCSWRNNSTSITIQQRKTGWQWCERRTKCGICEHYCSQSYGRKCGMLGRQTHWNQGLFLSIHSFIHSSILLSSWKWSITIWFVYGLFTVIANSWDYSIIGQ